MKKPLEVVYYTVIRHDGHLKTQECKKPSPAGLSVL